MTELGVKMNYVRIAELSMDGEEQDRPMYDEYAIRIVCGDRVVHIGGLDWEGMLAFNSTTMIDKLKREGLDWVIEAIDAWGHYTFMDETVHLKVC